MRATTLLVRQHVRLGDLLDRLEVAGAERIPLVLELVEQLMVHIALEAYFFYGSVRDASGLPLHAYHCKHALVRSALSQLVHAIADDRAFRERLRHLRAMLRDHVDAEEAELIPAAERAMDTRALDALGQRMETFYATAIAQAARG